MATKTQEIETAELVSIEQVERALFDPSVKLAVVEEDPEVVARRMIEHILAAPTKAAMYGTDVTHAKDAIGRDFTIREIEFRNSDFEGEGLPIFAVLHVNFTDTGELGIITSGAKGIVARCIWLLKNEALPEHSTIKSSTTNSGYQVLDLAPADSF